MQPGSRKALVQIDERCNLHCAHCFVSATKEGAFMSLASIIDVVIPRLQECQVQRVTLTGGEPTMHPDFLAVVCAFRAAGMAVGVCTNATTLSEDDIAELVAIGGVHCNVSLDGFSEHSHGKFRGNRASFHTTIATVTSLAEAGLLQGLLCTPNSLAQDEEYAQLCAFAREHGARYVLLNPLSRMGRGAKSSGRLASPDEHMRRIFADTVRFEDDELDIAHIRFPNTERRPLSGCEAGTILYVFTPGEVTVCPYLVFAARNSFAQHEPEEFIVGNIFTDADLAARLEEYRFHDRYQVGANPTCGACAMADDCGKGCPAAVIAAGGRIGDVDAEQCPQVEAEGRVLLPLRPA
ncbi:radical SAM protein [Saccharopolyspora gregorii]|uniref:radical SAM protein n=1 Tax=Saccharopolyspora gregorii TaxID=33914 RepID=UPI0021ACEAE3|nr:radical SAM protein [Saccharopolyspora gregorii]